MFTRLITHSGFFHADDVFAAATLRRLAPDAPIERTRSPRRLAEVTKLPDVAVFDVGDHYDPALQNFDHHQRDFHTTRDNGVPYAAFGLVWKTHGQAYCRDVLPDASNDTIEQVAARIEVRLVWAIDAVDCGAIHQRAHLHGAPDFALDLCDISRLISLFNPREARGQADFDDAFDRATEVASAALESETHHALAYLEAARVIHAADDGSPILFLETYVPWQAHVSDHHRFVLSPARDGSGWMVEAVQDSFVQRCPLPESWAGLRGEALAKEAGVEDAIFCHRARFITAAVSEAGARELARLALEHHKHHT